MYQPSTNFLGRDPMQWWIGQVTDPEKGEWGDSLESTQADDQKDIYSHRCRVRIVGYHGSDDDLPDKDLPLAHILLPPNTTTTGGCGGTVQYQGGEVVVGFFMDGEDAQQPVIFGTLFKQSFIEDKLTTSGFNSKKQTDFIPYTPPKVRQQAGKQQITKNSPVSLKFSPGEVVKTISQSQKEDATNIVIDNFSPCEDNEISKISNAIKDFTRKMQTLQQLNEANFSNPIFGGIVDAGQEVKLTANRIQNSMTKLIRRGRSWLIQDTLDKLNLTLSDKVDKFNQVPTGQATKTLADVIFCNLEKIQDSLNDYLVKSLENMIGQVLDVPICGIENFLGDMFGQINNIIDTGLGDMFDQLNSIQGGGLVLPSKTFSKAIRFANIITNILDCDNLNCPPPTNFSSKNGVTKSIDDFYDDILGKAGLNALKGLPDIIDDIADGIPAEPSAPDCNTEILKCGPPRVDFIGSSGQGATGSAIVNAVGNIIGVSINGPGFGFKEPPLLSFFDSCDKGYGAGGYPKMGPVSPVSTSPNTSAGGVGGLPVTVPNPDFDNVSNLPLTVPNPDFTGDDDEDGVSPFIPNPDLEPSELPLNAGGTGGSPIYGNDGDQIKTEGGLPVVAGGTGGIPILSDSVGGDPVDADLSNTYISDPNGDSLGVVDAVITDPGQEYLPNTTETDFDGNVKDVIPDPNANYDGESSYVTSLGDVVVANTGFGYEDTDTASVSGGSVAPAGDTLPGDALPDDTTGGIIQQVGQAEIELDIQDGLIVGANVLNGGFGFTKLPDITINSDTGLGAKLLPVLKFTRVNDASQLAQISQNAVVTVISCIDK